PSVYPVSILSSPSVKPFVFHSRFHISRSMGKKHPSHRVWKVHLLHLPLVLFEQTEIPALDIQVPYWVRSVQKTVLKRCDKMGFPISQQTQGFFHLVRGNDDIRIPETYKRCFTLTSQFIDILGSVEDIIQIFLKGVIYVLRQ